MVMVRRRAASGLGLGWVLVAATVAAAAADEGGGRRRRDVAYAGRGGARTTLDVYAPAAGEKRPVIVWIHGGAWRVGNKSHVGTKPDSFGAKGYALVSIDYRMFPEADFKGQAADVASAIRWVRDHAKEFGGDPSKIVLMGHSAGAHLAALAAIDGRYLAAEGLSPKDLAGVVLLDGAGYDIPRQIEQTPLPRLRTIYTDVFGEDPAAQRAASPITHVAKDRGIPPFLILHVARRRDSKLQSEALGKALRDAGVAAKVVPAEGKTHATINRELGDPGDAPTAEVFAFLKQHAPAP